MVNKKALKETAKGLGRIAINTAYVITTPLFIPTRIRQAIEKYGDSSVVVLGGALGGLITGTILTAAGVGYQEHCALKYALMIPIITNPLSGLYEYYRYNAKKFPDSTLPNPAEKNSSSSLEAKACEPLQPATQNPKKVTDPWSVDIPQIKNQLYNPEDKTKTGVQE